MVHCLHDTTTGKRNGTHFGAQFFCLFYLSCHVFFICLRGRHWRTVLEEFLWCGGVSPWSVLKFPIRLPAPLSCAPRFPSFFFVADFLNIFFFFLASPSGKRSSSLGATVRSFFSWYFGGSSLLESVPVIGANFRSLMAGDLQRNGNARRDDTCADPIQPN